MDVEHVKNIQSADTLEISVSLTLLCCLGSTPFIPTFFIWLSVIFLKRARNIERKNCFRVFLLESKKRQLSHFTNWDNPFLNPMQIWLLFLLHLQYCYLFISLSIFIFIIIISSPFLLSLSFLYFFVISSCFFPSFSSLCRYSAVNVLLYFNTSPIIFAPSAPILLSIYFIYILLLLFFSLSFSIYHNPDTM